MSDSQKILISYASEDRSFCFSLAEILQKSGFSVWIDVQSIKAGADWAKTIEEALAAADFVLAVHSKHSLSRSYQAKGEWLHALDLGKRVIPILIDSTVKVHRVLRHLQAVTFTYPEISPESIEKLLEAMRDENSYRSEPAGRIVHGGEPVYYPDLYDDRQVSCANLLANATDICCLATTGYRFLSRHRWFLDRLGTEDRFRLILAKPTKTNLNMLVLWSEKPSDVEYERVKGNVVEAARQLAKLEETSSCQLELHLFGSLAPFSTLQINRDTASGVIALGFHHVGRSTEAHPTIRPSTLLNRRNFPDLYEHYKASFDWIWDHSEPCTVSDLQVMLKDI